MPARDISVSPVQEEPEVRTQPTAMASGDTLESAVGDLAVPGSEGERLPFAAQLRTNMLYDLLMVPNIGGDIALGRHFSVGARWMYAWWSRSRSDFFWRIYGGDVSGRWWFGKEAREKRLQGHHVGVYGGAFIYDFELGGHGNMGGYPGASLWEQCQYVAAVEYGYTLPIARRLNLDFSVGVGYMGGKYVTYKPIDGHFVWDSTRRRSYFGPTKLEVSLVWLLGRDNFNIKKSKGK